MILRSRSAMPARAIIAVMAAALVPVIAGCEAGANAPTQNWHQPTPGASAVVDQVIRVNNLFVLGAAPTATLRPGAAAAVFLALSNSGSPDRLVSVTSSAARSVRLPAGGIGLGTQQTVLLTGPQPKVILEGLTRSLGGGQFVRMTLTFQRAGQVTLNVPVMPRASDYATYSPAPPPASAPTATPTVTAAAKNKKKKGTAATAAPTVSATPVAPTPTPSPTSTG